jgi:hypothetical protein
MSKLSSRPRAGIYRIGWKDAANEVVNNGAELLVLPDGHAELIETWWEAQGRGLPKQASGATHWLSRVSTEKAQAEIERRRGEMALALARGYDVGMSMARMREGV